MDPGRMLGDSPLDEAMQEVLFEEVEVYILRRQNTENALHCDATDSEPLQVNGVKARDMGH